MMDTREKPPFARLVGGRRSGNIRPDEPVLSAPMAVPFVARAGVSGLTGAAVESAYLADLDWEPIDTSPPDEAQETQPAVLPPVEEVLGDLSSLDRKALGQLRREFAQINHPDHSSGPGADIATSRMSLANRLIDDALAKLG